MCCREIGLDLWFISKQKVASMFVIYLKVDLEFITHYELQLQGKKLGKVFIQLLSDNGQSLIIKTWI